MSDNDTSVQDAVTTDAQDTQATPTVPPAVTPAPAAADDLHAVVSQLSAKVEELTGMVTAVIASGNGKQDSTPVRKPWTHYGSK